jgi:flagellar assembly protein FliH
MDESPVINDSDEFVPLVPEQEGAADDFVELPPDDVPDSPVINDSDEFVPMDAPRQAVTLPTEPGAVIKMAPVQEPARLDSVPFEFADIRALAQRILKRAQEQGQAKIDGARKQVAAMEKEAADKAYKEAFPKGEKDGYEKGLKDGAAESDKKIKEAITAEKEALRKNAAPTSTVLQQIIDALNASKQQLVAQAEGDLLLLALDLAKRLVGHELSVDPEAVRPLALECIGLVTDRTSITARVNPEDCKVLEEIIPELQSVFTDMGALHIVPDESIERGGIVAATREAEVDMQLATRLAAFEEVILGFSGEAAVAPWSAIPEEAIAAAKAAGAESQYSLYDDAGEATTEPQQEEPIPEEQLTEELPMQLETPPEAPAVDPDLAELAELADQVGEAES